MAPTVQLLLQHFGGHGESGGSIEAFRKQCVAAIIKADVLHKVDKSYHRRRQFLGLVLCVVRDHVPHAVGLVKTKFQFPLLNVTAGAGECCYIFQPGRLI